jgi:hypothetical protein
MRRFFGYCLIGSGLLWGLSANAENSYICPDSFQNLANSITQDLPDYINRSYTKLGTEEKAVFASFPNINPLPLTSGNVNLAAPHQFFFSMLTGRIGQPKTLVQPYWLFISKTTNGWRLSMAFTRIGLSPPIDVSDGFIADATRTWLMDRCN